MAIYLLNCIDEISNTLSLYEFVDDWRERLQVIYIQLINIINKKEKNILKFK